PRAFATLTTVSAICTLSLHDALPIFDRRGRPVPLSRYRGKPLLVSFIYTGCFQVCPTQTRALQEAVRGLDVLLGSDRFNVVSIRSEEHTSELQSREKLVCRLLLEKKK